jgi:hypothetical protein
MAIERITFSAPVETAKAARKKAKAERRSLSNYIGNLIEVDAAPASLDEQADLAAYAQEIGPAKALQILERATRKQRAAG